MEKKKYIVVSAYSIPELIEAVNGMVDYDPVGGILSAITQTLYLPAPAGWHQAMVLNPESKPLVTTKEHLEDINTDFHLIPPREQVGHSVCVSLEGDLTVSQEKAPYGYCPICGAKGVSRERGLNGNDKCENGHSYPSLQALKEGFKSAKKVYFNLCKETGGLFYIGGSGYDTFEGAQNNRPHDLKYFIKTIEVEL